MAIWRYRRRLDHARHPCPDRRTYLRMVSFALDTWFCDGYAFHVGACDFSHHQQSVRAHELRSAMAATMVLAIGTRVSRCRRHASQRLDEESVRQSKTRVGRSADGSRGPQFSQRTHNDGNDCLWLHGYLSVAKSRVLASAFSYGDRDAVARFPGCAKQDVFGGALPKRCAGGDGSGNGLARALLDDRRNNTPSPRVIVFPWPTHAGGGRHDGQGLG